jgi:molybdenum storage protein
MSDLVGGDGRTHIRSPLMRESLQDARVIAQTDTGRDLRVFPDVTLVSIGGQSIFDRGKAALLPLVAELVEISATAR